MSFIDFNTSSTVEEIMSAAQVGVFRKWKLGYGTRKSAARRGRWSALRPADGGVFAALSVAPAWAARFDLPDPNGNGGAHCEIQVFDDGSQRRVQIDCAGSLPYRGVAKNMASGVAEEIEALGGSS